MFPAYDLNHAYQDTDVFVSMAKLKNHATCGVTLSMKNCFGITPASIYGDDAGVDEPNENPNAGRVETMHEGQAAAVEIGARRNSTPNPAATRAIACRASWRTWRDAAGGSRDHRRHRIHCGRRRPVDQRRSLRYSPAC